MGFWFFGGCFRLVLVGVGFLGVRVFYLLVVLVFWGGGGLVFWLVLDLMVCCLLSGVFDGLECVCLVLLCVCVFCCCGCLLGLFFCCVWGFAVLWVFMVVVFVLGVLSVGCWCGFFGLVSVVGRFLWFCMVFFLWFLLEWGFFGGGGVLL